MHIGLGTVYDFVIVMIIFSTACMSVQMFWMEIHATGKFTMNEVYDNTVHDGVLRSIVSSFKSC